jgi:hypothetical protein
MKYVRRYYALAIWQLASLVEAFNRAMDVVLAHLEK